MYIQSLQEKLQKLDTYKSVIKKQEKVISRLEALLLEKHGKGDEIKGTLDASDSAELGLFKMLSDENKTLKSKVAELEKIVAEKEGSRAEERVRQLEEELDEAKKK